MANIRVDLTEPLVNGMDIKFKAPCDCTAITGLIAYYPLDDGSGTQSRAFTFKDAHGNALTGLGNLFSAGALVKVMVDTETNAAYIQNADTNKYLEQRLAEAGSQITLSSSVTSTSTTTAANSYAVKLAYDKAVAAASSTEGEGTVYMATMDGGTVHTYTCEYVCVGNIMLVCVYASVTFAENQAWCDLGVNGLPSRQKMAIGVTKFGDVPVMLSLNAATNASLKVETLDGTDLPTTKSSFQIIIPVWRN